jgi:hypothetical protein
MLTPDEILTRAKALAEHAIANRDRCGQAARELADWTARGAPIADTQEQSARLEICRACEHWKPVGESSVMHCAQCKCIAVKLKLKTSVCPLSKW